MNPKVKNVLAVIIGLVVGSLINSGLITLGHTVFPIEGIDPNDMEAYAKVMPDLEPKHFIFPFLAHAIGTLAGVLTAVQIAASHKFRIAMIIGVLFLLGGIAASFMFEAPAWFIALDLILAYIPMAWLGNKLANRKKA